jgi:hypothetical protein
MTRTLRWLRRPLAVAAVASLALSLPAVASARDDDNKSERLSSFGRMFPKLKGFVPTDEALTALVQTQLDPGADELDNEGVPAGFTYFGQFIDHDLTRNLDPLPAAQLDPTTLKNFRTARFDLDSVYGGGSAKSPQLYEEDGKHLLVQEENENGVPDLARDENGGAVLVEPRNDENLIIAQLHLAVAKFHNRLVDEGASFKQAQRLTQWHYQWVVVNDYLPHVVGQRAVDRFLDGTKVRREFYKPGNPNAPMTPTEFSTAIFRYGHSQVRDSYEVNDLSEEEPIKVFDLTGAPDLRGGQHLTELTHIDWSEFFEIDGAQEFEGNLSRQLDTKISESLFNLPLGAPGLPSNGTNILAQLTLIRSARYDIPSGQDVARAMGIKPIRNSVLGLGPEFNGEAPLWYYMLAESELKQGGAILGKVGGRIIAEVFLNQLAIDRDSYLNAKRSGRGNRGFRPTVEHEGEFTIGDFLTFAGVVELEDEEEEEEGLTP